ncbi:MFS general substrate transporter [Phellopilus nigrolimitatus]|nr:MFS general substrate transporter [Phellopilus nigrolimitatus]
MASSVSETASRVLSVPRLATLSSSIVVSLSSGTNYVSPYAPQLGSRLRISHTKLNVIGMDLGMYSTGPFWGRIVDRRGPRILLACGSIFLLAGYSGIRHFYDSPDTRIQQSETDTEKLSHVAFTVLIACSFLTGAGGSGGLAGSVNATAKSFPDHMRASTTALVLSGFGLSAFFFSTIAHVLYPGDTSSFLLLLALGTCFPMILGFFFVRPIPLSPAVDEPAAPTRRGSISEIPHDGFARSAGVDGVFGGDALVFEHHNDSRTTLLSTHRHAHHLHHSHPASEESLYVHEEHDAAAPRARSVELAVSPPPTSRRHRSFSEAPSHRRSRSRVIEVMQDLYGKALLSGGDFWLLFSMLSLMSGTGLMYINNVGSISQALFAKGNPDFDEIESAKWQSMQVSIISIANCLGRILSGVGADLVKNRLELPRTYCLCVVAVLFVLSQVLATHIENVESLWQASTLLGLAYGGMFGLYPTIVIEWFGLAHFSENWGLVSLSPLIGGNLFSLAFGRNLDAHVPPSDPAEGETSATLRLLSRAGLPPGEQCFAGRECYVSSLYLTICACALALALSVYAAWKDRRRMTVKQADYEEIIWEEDEEV